VEPVATATTECWKVPASGMLLWEQWNDEYIVYNARSGETHFLNELAAKALKALEDFPCNAEQLAQKMTVQHELEMAFRIADMERLIQEFDSLGLIEPCP
jgi:PqqD family protein of HPr-rel-A system